jgi:hypothetical protein
MTNTTEEVGTREPMPDDVVIVGAGPAAEFATFSLRCSEGAEDRMSPFVSDGTTVKVIEPVIVARKIDPAKRRAAGRRIAVNIRRLQKSKTKRTATQALAKARGERFAR